MLSTFPKCNFQRNFRIYSIKIIYAIIDWVSGISKIMHCGILINMPFLPDDIPQSHRDSSFARHSLVVDNQYRPSWTFLRRCNYHIALSTQQANTVPPHILWIVKKLHYTRIIFYLFQQQHNSQHLRWAQFLIFVRYRILWILWGPLQ